MHGVRSTVLHLPAPRMLKIAPELIDDDLGQCRMGIGISDVSK